MELKWIIIHSDEVEKNETMYDKEIDLPKQSGNR